MLAAMSESSARVFREVETLTVKDHGRVAATARLPGFVLVDADGVEITAATDREVTVYTPPMKRASHTRTPDQPSPGDSAAVKAWRARMATDEAKAIYKQRASTAEWINAGLRTHRSLARLLVRGLTKVHTWVLWVALAHSMMRTMEIVPHRMT